MPVPAIRESKPGRCVHPSAPNLRDIPFGFRALQHLEMLNIDTGCEIVFESAIGGIRLEAIIA